MIPNLWINLPVKNLENSLQFFKEIGFVEKSAKLTSSEFLRLEIARAGIMLFHESKIREFIHHKLSNPKSGSEMLLSVELGSREEVGKIFEKLLILMKSMAGYTMRVSKPRWIGMELIIYGYR